VLRLTTFIPLSLLRCAISFVILATISPSFSQDVAAASALRMGASIPRDFDDFVNAQMKAWDVPGLAVAVVTKDHVLLAKGYGYADLESKRAVTPQTLFPIASLTKSFTAASLLILAREGKLDLDKPVREYLQDFQMHDASATQLLTPRDLLSHRSGLPRHEYVWFGTDYSRENLYRKLRYLEPVAPPRSEFQYQNLMYMTAGYLGGRVAGADWETLVQQKIFAPLDMQRANFTVGELLANPDHALGYAKDASKAVIKLDYEALDAMGPTGSINASITDMAKYAQMYLGKAGVPLQAQDVAQMGRPHTAISELSPFLERGITNYGLGMFVSTYRGHRYVFHGGNLTGASSYFAFFPEQGFAVVALSNMTVSLLPNVASFRIFDHMLKQSTVDWSQRLLALEEKTRADDARAKGQKNSQQRSGTQPSHAINEYVGQYSHPGYGIATITNKSGALQMHFNGETTAIDHLHFDVFQAPSNLLNRLGLMKVMFHADWSGEISALSIPFEPRVSDIRFVKQGNAAMRDASFLVPFVGSYEFRGLNITVDIRGDRLVVSIPGQPVHELEGVRDQLFRIKGLSGYSVEFAQPDASGTTPQMTMFQPNGIYVAERKQQ
jgi:CubicO group peptidase (beta-lactamase class C family)